MSKNNNPIGLEELEKFINDLGVETKWINKDNIGFSRTLEFTVYETKYIIVWFKNESTLKIGTHKRAPLVKFRYLYLDNTYPLIGGNKSIGFAYTKFEKTTMFSKEYPYESFRIPLEI